MKKIVLVCLFTMMAGFAQAADKLAQELKSVFAGDYVLAAGQNVEMCGLSGIHVSVKSVVIKNKKTVRTSVLLQGLDPQSGEVSGDGINLQNVNGAAVIYNGIKAITTYDNKAKQLKSVATVSNPEISDKTLTSTTTLTRVYAPKPTISLSMQTDLSDQELPACTYVQK